MNDKLITFEQLSEALELQKKSNQRLSEILSELKFLSDEAIAHAFSMHFQIPYIDISAYFIDKSFADYLPERIARNYTLIPFNKAWKKLTIVMADPLDLQAVDDVKLISGIELKKVKIAVAKRSDINEAIENIYGR